MKLTTLLIGGILLLHGPTPATAQCLALADLLALSQPPPRTDSTTPPLTPGPLAAWTARGPVMPGDAEQYWIKAGSNPGSGSGLAGPAIDSLAQGWLGLRPSTGPAAARDVRYKSTQADCLAGLRRELARARYPAQLVTALDGEAVRFEAPAFSVTLYILTKGQFRYVAVLRVRPPGTSATQPPPVNRRLISPSGIPRLQPKYGELK